MADKTAIIYRYYKVLQHSIPEDGFILAIVAIQVICLYALPLANLNTDNVPLDVVFAFLGLFSALCHYINPRALFKNNKRGMFATPSTPGRRRIRGCGGRSRGCTIL